MLTTACGRLALVAVLMTAAAAVAAEPAAFLTEATTGALLRRAAGGDTVAVVGAQLRPGDEVRANDGAAVVMYLSGRTVRLAAGETHRISGGSTGQSPLIGRVRNTLSEIVGPRADADRPVVQGMARETVTLTGALPANSRVGCPRFRFTWDALAEAEGYRVVIESAAGVSVVDTVVAAPELAAAGLPLVPGQRYRWQVREAGALMPRGSGRQWLEVATAEQWAGQRQVDEALAEEYRGSTYVLMRTAALVAAEYLYDAHLFLERVAERRPLLGAEQRARAALYARMERWERLD